MNDTEYAEGRAILERADDIRGAVMEEAEARGDVYTLHAWYYHSLNEWTFLTLADAVDRAQDDCSPVKIVGPDGREYDPYEGTERESSVPDGE
jgi:hypothetical protein